jgi:sugar phosphate isomerase/epimerase
MRIGTTIRHDMGEGHIIKDIASLLDFLKLFPDLDFIEIYCTYPIPLVFNEDIAKLKTFLKNNNMDVGLHFPVEWHDRWLKKKKYEEVLNIVVEFAKKIDAAYINIHPDDLAYFLNSRDDNLIRKEIVKIADLAGCAVLVENGHSVYNNPGDNDYFLDNKKIDMCLDMCHVYQADFQFEDFEQYFQKAFLFHLSDVGERAHMELGLGQIPFSDLLGKLKMTGCYGLLLESLLTMEGDIVLRNPTRATRNSIDFIRSHIESVV